MARPSRSPGFIALQRRQLDAKLGQLDLPASPRNGWIRAIRAALGMSASQLGSRLGMTQQGALDLERRERNGSITIAKLSQAATALNCELRVIFVPRQSLEETITRQAEAKTRAERNSIVHTMRLEGQEEGVESALGQGQASNAWLTTRIARLWDPER